MFSTTLLVVVKVGLAIYTFTFVVFVIYVVVMTVACLFVVGYQWQDSQ